MPNCRSTNDELAGLLQKNELPEGFVIFTDHQTKGKGRRNKQWSDEPAKDILVSILLKPIFLIPQAHFFLNFIVSLAVKHCVQSLVTNPQYIKVKWPNDVFAGNKKIAGVLIENTLQGNQIETSIVGIGLNLNSSKLSYVNTTSILLETGQFFERNMVMEKLFFELEKRYEFLKQNQIETIRSEYINNLLWINEPKSFNTHIGKIRGQIKGIDEQGRIIIQTHNQRLAFNMDEINFA